MGIGHLLRTISIPFIGFLFSMCVMQNIYAQSEELMLQRSLELQPTMPVCRPLWALFTHKGGI